MMFIEGDNADFNAIVYGQPHPNTLRFLQQQIANVTQSTTGVAREFFERSSQVFEAFNGHDALRRAKSALAQVGAIFAPDIIYPIHEVTQFQAAPNRMRRYLLADVQIRELYNDQRIEGWDKRYLNLQPNDIGDTHWDYQRLNEGIVKVDPQGEAWVNHYFDFHEDTEEHELDHSEQIDMYANSLRFKKIVELCKDDPSSIYGALL